MVRVVFMGTPDFAVPSLETLIEHQHVVGVVTQPDRPAGRGRRVQEPPVKEVARGFGLPVYQPKSLRSEESAVPLTEWSPDLIVVAAYGQILRPHVLTMPRHGCLNVHASLLPRWRGAAPIQHAILAGDDRTGISLMKMDEGLDTGPVFVQEAIKIREGETAASLHDRLAQLGAGMLAMHLDAILDGRLEAQAQVDDEATYAPMIKKEDGVIDWTKSGYQIDRLLRAMTPWPGAFTTWEGVRLIIAGGAIKALDYSPKQPGLVVSRQNEVLVLTGDGALQLDKVQLAGKKMVAVKDFIRGRPHFIGSQLGS